MVDYTIFHEELRQLFLLNESTLKPCQISVSNELPLMSFRTLCILHDNNGYSINELSRLLNITKQQTFVIIKRLEEKHYLYVEKDPNDKRKVCIYLTPKAIELVENRLSLITKDIWNLLQNCSVENQERLLDAIHHLFTCIQDCKEELQ